MLTVNIVDFLNQDKIPESEKYNEKIFQMY